MQRHRPIPDRRAVLAGTAATLLASRLPAQTPALDTAPDRDWSALAAAFTSLPQLQSVQIAHRGEIVIAEAPRGPGLDRLANLKSVSKSLVALLLGAAIDRKLVPDVTATLAEVAPALIPAGADPRVARLTLQDLVTLRAGLERTSGPGYGGWIASPDWVADALSREFVADPGGRMLYSTGTTHVLGAALSEATGQSLLSLARDWLGRPLQIEIPPWTRDPQGRYMGGNEMAMTPRALLRVGEMIRQGGSWNGTQVISADWIARSQEPRGRSPWSGLDYGYGWFLGGRGQGRFMLARGYGGQVLCIVPGRDLTLAITSDPTQPARSDGYFGDLQRLIEGPLMTLAAT